MKSSYPYSLQVCSSKVLSKKAIAYLVIRKRAQECSVVKYTSTKYLVKYLICIVFKRFLLCIEIYLYTYIKFKFQVR